MGTPMFHHVRPLCLALTYNMVGILLPHEPMDPPPPRGHGNQPAFLEYPALMNDSLMTHALLQETIYMRDN